MSRTPASNRDTYFGINLEEVWSAVDRDLPELKRKVQEILEELER